LAFSTCPPWSRAASCEMARTCVGLPFWLRLGSGDLRPGPRDLRLSFRETLRFARSVSRSGRAGAQNWPEGSFSASARSVWDRDSSHGVVNDRPSVDTPLQRPLPVANWLRRTSRCLALRRARDLGFVHAHRLEDATLRACSVLAVPPDFDGLLRWAGRGSVAPRSRPWGSPCFRTRSSRLSVPPSRRGPHARCAAPPKRLSLPLPRRADALPRGGARGGASAALAHAKSVTIPDGATPFEAFPSPTAAPRHRGRCPLAIRSAACHLVPATPEGVRGWRLRPWTLTTGPCSVVESVVPR